MFQRRMITSNKWYEFSSKKIVSTFV